MKSVIKRLKRRSSPTVASALMSPPVSMQTDHPLVDTSSPRQEQSIGTIRETASTPPPSNPSAQAPTHSLRPNRSSGLAHSTSHYQGQQKVVQGDSLLRIPQNTNSSSSVALEGLSSNQSLRSTSRVSSNPEEKPSAHSPCEEGAQLKSKKDEGISNPSFPKGSSVRTFGDKPHQPELKKPVLDDSERDSSTYHEERHTLKPIVRETIHKHVVEEVQKVKLHERHFTYIQHHVQPIIQASSEIESQDYRIELPNQEPSGPDGDRINIRRNSKLDTIIQDLIESNRQRYEADGMSSLRPEQPDEASSAVEHRGTVVHNYHIIQPVVLKPTRPLHPTADRHAINPSVSDQAQSTKKPPEETSTQQIRQLNKLIDGLQAENRDLKKSLSRALASRNSAR